MENNNVQNIENGYYEPAPQTPVQRREYTTAQRLLLLATLALGAVFSWVLCSKATFEAQTLREPGIRYGAFWLVYLVGFYAITWKTSSKKPIGWALASLVVWLAARWLVYSEYTLGFLNFLVIPLVLMLHAVECTASVPLSRQGGYIAAYTDGWFVSPFICIPRFFGAVGSLTKKKGDPRSRAIRIGVLAGLAAAAVVVPLLLSSDLAMQRLLEGALDGFDPIETVLRVMGAIIVAMLFYSFIYRIAFEPNKLKAEPYRATLEGAGVCAALGILLGIYALFAAFQFTYLTGFAGLPEGLTYSEYAVRGFEELCTVASINFAAFAVCLTFAKPTRGVRALLVALLAATAMLLVCAAARLALYISAYGLTVNRILPLWFMLFLFALLALCALKLRLPGLRLLRIAAGTLVALYLALSLVNLDAVVASSVLARAAQRGSLSREDADFLRYTLSGDATDVLKNSELKYEIYYDVEPEDIERFAEE